MAERERERGGDKLAVAKRGKEELKWQREKDKIAVA